MKTLFNTEDFANFEELENELEFLVEDIECSTEYENDLIVIIDEGRWNGRVDGFKTVRTIHEAFEVLSKYNDFVIEYNRGIKITGYHHDGTDYLTIKELKRDNIQFDTILNALGSSKAMCSLAKSIRLDW